MIKKWQISLTLAFLILGLLLSFQFKTKQAIIHELSNQKPSDLYPLLSDLDKKNKEYARQLEELRFQKRLFEQDTSYRQKLDILKRDLDKLDIAIGTTPLTGEGITVTIAEPKDFFSYQDLLAIVNDIWNAGAEAISVNGIRLTNTTAITEYPEEPFIAINNTKLTYPIEIKAIGKSQTLASGINIPLGITSQLIIKGYPIVIKTEDKIEIPAAKEIQTFTVAEPKL